jgi:hypothetical protein
MVVNNEKQLTAQAEAVLGSSGQYDVVALRRCGMENMK